MRTALVAYGTRGDMQPFICLGRALADRGHSVELVATGDGEALARAAGLPFRPLPIDMQALIRSEPAQRMLADGRIGTFFRWLGTEERAFAAEMGQALIEAGRAADLIVCGAFQTLRCRAIADAHGSALVPLHLTPVFPSRKYTSTLLPQRRLGPLTRPAHLLPLWTYWRTQLEDLRELRDELGLPPPSWSAWRELFSGEVPCLLAYSQTLFPRPGDWPPAPHQAGSFAPGVPTLVCSVFADQPFWGARCRALGIGDTVPFAKLDARRLSAGLRSVLKPQVAKRAQEVGRRIAEEDGVGRAVEHLEREFLSGQPAPEVPVRVGSAP